MLKKFLLTLAAILSITTVTFAGNVNVQLNGETLDFTDSEGNIVNAQIINNRTMVPLRKIFESLGATVDWDNNTQTAFATKDNISIKLQIDNPIAEVTKNGITKKVTLDSKPVLMDNRTLVPMRFISESLEKQVAWDQNTQTAIIIDYDYFENKLSEKSPLLEKFIAKDDLQNYNFTITRKYYDLSDATKNTTSKIDAYILKESENNRKIDLVFSGNSTLFNEIANEGWSNTRINLVYEDSKINYTSNADALNKLWNTNSSSLDELYLEGSPNKSLGEVLKGKFGIKENQINSNTFKEVKSEYENFLNAFSFENKNGESKITLKNINGLNAGTYVDIAEFDNIIFDEEIIKTYNVINKLTFNYDIDNELMMYEYPVINFAMNLTENTANILASATIELLNDYNEKIIYEISISK